MEPSPEPEITCLVLLYKAYIQQRFKLESEIKLQCISSNFYKYNTNHRYYLEVIPKAKQLKISYLNLLRNLKILNEKNRHSAETEALKSRISSSFIEINSLSDKILGNLCNFEIQKHKFNALNYNLQEKQAKLEQLKALHQVNSKSLKAWEWKKAQVESKKHSINSLKEKILKIRVKIENLSLKDEDSTPRYLQDVKTVQSYKKLTKSHLLLRSKILLKNDICMLLESAKQTYESQIHFLKLEKRRIQKIHHQDTKNDEKKNSDVIQTRPCTFSKEHFEAEIAEYFECISPINSRPVLPFTEESFQEDIKDCDQLASDLINSLSDSLRKRNEELKEKISKLSSKVHSIGNKLVEIN
jgi:hypothetical protein